MDHHFLRATSDYDGTQGSATLLLNVQLAGDQANQPFTTFIRNDGPNPGLHVKLGFWANGATPGLAPSKPQLIDK